MKPVGEMTEAELAAFVEEHLAKRGIRLVLSGGTCVTIYGGRAYVSGDLDLVLEAYAKPKDVSDALAELGFERRERTFHHPESALFVDIRHWPPAVGSEPIGEVRELQTAAGRLRTISPTDCVKDRLANYYYHNDRQCLEQACLVVACSEVDLTAVESWSGHEGQQTAFEEIRERLRSADAERRRKAARPHTAP